MKDLIFSIGRFCENHVEKIVLVLVSIVCAWLFFTRVIFSPNVVELDGKTYSPGQVDAEVQEKARALQQRLQNDDTSETARAFDSVRQTPIDANDPVNPLGRPLPKGFVGLFESPLSHLNRDLGASMPSAAVARGGDRRYVLPTIPPVTDVAVNYIRAAAYVPVYELTPEVDYDKAENEVNDVDLVTVEAQFDVAALYRRFTAHFAGEEVAKEEWRDPCLAEPVLAAVQLQRRYLLDNGTWGDWHDVPRSRTEANSELFQVYETIDKLPPGGLNVRLMSFDSPMVTMDLLQPEAYRLASADEEWFPPSFYDKFKSIQKKIAIEERREERESQRDQRDQTSGRRRDTATGFGNRSTMTGAGGRFRSGTGGAGDTGYSRSRSRSRTTNPAGPGYAGTAQDGRSRRGTQGRRRSNVPGGDMMYGDMYGSEIGLEATRKPTTDEVYWEFGEKLLDWRTELAEMEEPVLFWAFDDSARPGMNCQYQIRVGVFNPVAGTEQLVEQDMDKANQVILWSDFSKATEPVHIPRRLYFFAKDVKDRTKTATVEVARYKLGYWYTQNFQVAPGEVIGQEMEPQERKEREERRARSARITGGAGAAYGDYGGAYPMDSMMPGGYGYGAMSDPDEAVIPELVDYSTGTVLVDLVETNDWAGTPPNLQPRMYHEMLYTGDGTEIERMPVSMRNWPKNLVDAYQVIQTAKRKEREAFKDFKKGGIRSRVRPPGMEGYEGMGGMYDEMMYGMPPGRR
jgi:hypothetical protein